MNGVLRFFRSAPKGKGKKSGPAVFPIRFSDCCLILFIALLMTGAFFLAVKREPVAEKLADGAYLVLALGVTAKLAEFLARQRNEC